ncbi:hypothetical protein CVT24_001970 [Panaeolus cyanescens]|uniref:non-specific serine/threonine protein kinase n=1 Tax=Panaeolus cyanescens TaxID=181874 RepID=A0A409YHP3_9AGAR|nr:hypothetical protein CVT24_001970 [Panaeolus cyanescens]
MLPKDWLELLNVPDGAYKEHLKVLLQPQKDTSYYIPKHLQSDKQFQPRPALLMEDTHISQELILRHVYQVPSLLEDLQKEFVLQLKEFLSTNGIPVKRQYLPSPGTIAGRVECIRDMFQFHKKRVGTVGILYSSHLHILPDTNRWLTPFVNIDLVLPGEPFIDIRTIIPGRNKLQLPIPDYGLRKEVVNLLKPPVAEKLEDARSRRKGIAILIFYPPTEDGEKVVENFTDPGFKYTLPTADSHNLPSTSSTYFLSSDWETACWSKYADQLEIPGRVTQATKSRCSKTIWIPGSPDRDSKHRRQEGYTPVASHFIQRAWNTAVEHDATFLLISCGTKERIGIRHRATNSLFLSDIIRPEDDDYIITQIAFYSALTRDFLARELPPKPSAKRKRSDGDLSTTDDNPRLPKPRAKNDKSVDKTFDKEMANRSVILLTVDMGVHMSSSPSTFLRERASCAPLPASESFARQQGGCECSITQCVYIQLRRILGHGAEAVIYQAMATLHLESGMTMEKNVAVKIPKLEHEHHLQNEYDKYRQLAMAGVSEGILKVYGVFKDVEFGTTMMVMQDGGMSLEKREQKRLNHPELLPVNLIQITDDEYVALRRAILAINKAGILHYDIKTTNILIDDDETPYIIDFGHAVVWEHSKFPADTSSYDPPWSKVDPRRLEIVEASISELPDGVRSYDLQTIEDIYIGSDFVARPPLLIQDPHVSQEISLRHVYHVPSLLEDLRHEFYLQLAQYLSTHGIPDVESECVPSALEFPGEVRYIRDMFMPFIDAFTIVPSGDRLQLPIPDFCLREEAARLIDASVAEKLVAARRELNGIAILIFYPPTDDGETVVDRFIEPGFKYTIPSADSHYLPSTTSTSFLLSDWPTSFWARYVDQLDVPSPTSTRRAKNYHSKTIWIPGPPDEQPSQEEYTPVVPHYVQRAWNAAAEHDATFLLVSCGTKERIGIRHRATNTLFLSDVIRPENDDYVITQVAFYSALTRDFLAREPPPKPSVKRKRSEEDLAVHDRNPRLEKPRAKSDESINKTFDKEMANRSVVLLTFDMGINRSVAPSTFLRERASCASAPRPAYESKSFERQQSGSECSITQCIYIQLRKIIGEGLEGVVYKARAILHLESGMIMERCVVVKVPKLGYLGYLRNEYDMYYKLAMAGVSEGVLQVYGSFKDVEFGTTMMVMQDGGITLEKREQKRLNLAEPPTVNLLQITDNEYDALRRAILAINGTGILHNDVKANNILIDDNGTPYIIDFGHAVVWKYGNFVAESTTDDRPWSTIDPRRLEMVEASISELPEGVRSYDLQTIEDIYIGRHATNRRYPGRN